MLNAKGFYQYSTYLLAKEAERRGIKVKKIFPKTKKSLLILKQKGKLETIIGQRVSTLSFNAYYVCKHKEMTKQFLRRSGIKTVDGDLFSEDEINEALKYIKKISHPVVIKPVDATWGKNVFLNIKNVEKARMAMKEILKNKNQFMVEKQYIGNEYRILATRNKLLGVINRIPANVVGDGINSVKNLIKIKNKDPGRGESHENALVKIKIDKEIRDNLEEMKINLNYIPSKGKTIYLRKKSNLSAGGDSIDVTDKIHPNIKKLAPKVIKAIPGLPYAGFDFMTADITKDPYKVGYAVIEINDSPMLSMHHEPYIGKKRNVAEDIINLVFPKK